MLALAIVGTLDTVLSHISPNYRPTIVTEILPSWWTWQVWWIALLIVVLIATLHTASRRIRELTPLDIGINLVFNPAKPDYKQIDGDYETYIIGASGRGRAIENPEVLVHSLFRRTLGHIVIDVSKVRLRPTPSSLAVINTGITPTYFVNVFVHKVGQREITFCHFDHSGKPIPLEVGEWQLVLLARGSNSTEEEVIRLLLSLDGNGNLEVTRKIKE
jgi:hypothetical protein